jgi:PhzF family phenazine biosynthesis protein
MKKLPDIYQIDAFTNQPFQGNSAGVVFSDELNENEMQLIAREMNVSETAFISSSDKADFHLRWFTPKVEVKLCGHATIASMHYLIERGIVEENTKVTFNTLSGILTCRSEKKLHYLNLPIPKIEIFNGNKEEIKNALSIKTEAVNDEFPFLVSDNSYLFIFLKSLKELGQLTPDFGLLYKLTEQEKGFDAITVFTTETFKANNSAHLRFFAPFFGIDEDPVTGSANGPLLLVLQELGLIDKETDGKSFTFEQGDFLGRIGRVNVTFSSSKNELAIAGNAVTVLKGELIY